MSNQPSQPPVDSSQISRSRIHLSSNLNVRFFFPFPVWRNQLTKLKIVSLQAAHVQGSSQLTVVYFCFCLPADSIEANVENAEVHVERGTEQLQRAAYYQVGVSVTTLWRHSAQTLTITLLSRLYRSKSPGRRSASWLWAASSCSSYSPSSSGRRPNEPMSSSQCNRFSPLPPAWNQKKSKKRLIPAPRTVQHVYKGLVDVGIVVIWSKQAFVFL